MQDAINIIRKSPVTHAGLSTLLAVVAEYAYKLDLKGMTAVCDSIDRAYMQLDDVHAPTEDDYVEWAKDYRDDQYGFTFEELQ